MDLRIGGVYIVALLLQEYAQVCASAERRDAIDDWRTCRDRWVLEALCRHASTLAGTLPTIAIHREREVHCASWGTSP